jgi:hypothetical protein
MLKSGRPAKSGSRGCDAARTEGHEVKTMKIMGLDDYPALHGEALSDTSIRTDDQYSSEGLEKIMSW